MPSDSYLYYVSFLNWYCKPLRSTSPTRWLDEYELMVDELVEPLGDLSCDDITFRRVTTAIGLKRVVNRLLEQDYGVSVDIRTAHGAHTVGLLPAEHDRFTLVSNHIPVKLNKPLTLEDIAPRLYVPKEEPIKNYPFHGSNVTALPPVV